MTGGRRDFLANIRSRVNPRNFRQRKDPGFRCTGVLGRMMNTCISALSACRPEFFLVGVRSLHMGYPIGAALRVLRLRFRMNRMKWLR